MKREPNPSQRRFGELLRARREQAGLSRPLLGKKARLSDSTIKAIEAGTYTVARRSVVRLQLVKELHLTQSDLLLYTDLPEGYDAEPSAQAPLIRPESRRCSAILCASGDALAHHRDHRALLRGVGGFARAAWSYIDAAGASDWRRYAQSRQAGPLRWVVQSLAPRIAQLCAGARLDLLALGSGLGEAEAGLAAALLEWESIPYLSLGFCDLSGPLLAAAYQRASDALASADRAEVWGMLVDLEQLTTEADVIVRPGWVRCFTLLGGVLGELDRDDSFLRLTLPALALPGDLLLLDLGQDQLADEESDSVRALRDAWLLGSYERAGLQAPAIEVGAAKPGVWAHEEREVYAVANRRRWSCYRLRRYHPDAVTAHLAAVGWGVVEMMRYPGGGTLLLCRRVDGK